MSCWLQPQSLALGLELTPVVEAAMPELLRMIVGELGALGVHPAPREAARVT